MIRIGIPNFVLKIIYQEFEKSVPWGTSAERCTHCHRGGQTTGASVSIFSNQK